MIKTNKSKIQILQYSRLVYEKTAAVTEKGYIELRGFCNAGNILFLKE